MPSRLLLLSAFLTISATGCATLGAFDRSPERSEARAAVLTRAQVWRPTTIRAANITRGPQGPGAVRPQATVRCEYVDKKQNGNSPKFVCRVGEDDELKVKYGGTNGEVYGEMLATRLLWALGFGADAMYTVNVICRGCPATLGGIERPDEGESRFDPAVIERKMPGVEWPPDGESGWSWQEIDETDPKRGGAPQAHRDALKLLAVFIQHSDSKPEQQRIVCLGGLGPAGACRRPFLMISDVGLTFGAATRANDNERTGVNLERWRRTPVWKDETGCVGNLPKSFTGTLDHPVISEGGRRFLANLLVQLSDAQIRDLFEAARVNLRLRSPADASSGLAPVSEWVAAFKDKRTQILTRRCA